MENNTIINKYEYKNELLCILITVNLLLPHPECTGIILVSNSTALDILHYIYQFNTFDFLINASNTTEKQSFPKDFKECF